jgi:PAS domain S-box-containing protein
MGSRMALLAAGFGLAAAALGAFGLHQALRLSRLSAAPAESTLAGVIAGEQSLRDLERLRGYGLAMVVAGDARDRQRALAAVAQLSNALSQGPDPRPGALASKAETTLRQVAARMAQAPDSASARHEAVATWTPVGAELSAATDRLAREMSQSAAGQAGRSQAVIAQGTTRMSAVLVALVALLMLGLGLFRRAVNRPLRRLEDALAVRERDYRTLAENSPDPIIRFDRDCRRLYVNSMVSRVLGKPGAALIGGSPADGAVLVAGEGNKLMAAIRQVFETDQTTHVDLDYIDQDGQCRDYHMLLVPERDASGRVATVLSIGRDLTSIRDAERRLTRLVANVPGFVFSLHRSPKGQFSFPFVSPGIEEFCGMRQDQVGDDIAALRAWLHAEDAPRVERALAEAARAVTSLHIEFRVRCPDRPERWVECRATPEREADGGLLWHGIVFDASERKHLETELGRRAAEFRTLADNSPDAIVRYDRAGRRLYCNPALATAVGVPQAALLGKSIAEFSPFPADVAQAKAALVRQVMDSGRTGDIELHWERKGVPACLQVRITPEFDAAGRVVSALSVGRDISALKQAEARLHKSHDILRALAAHQETEREKERQEIASQIHEDLAQNLSALRMNISLVEMNAEAAPRVPLLKGMREIVDRSIARIRDLVSVLRPTVLDLGLVPALHWLTDDFKGVGFQFELALPRELALRDEASIFLFRAAQEIMINVALHAGATHVHLSLASVAGVCHLRVRDNGRGFDPGAPRAQNTFGLIGMAAQAQHLGGGLLVDSKPGQGTLIEVRVPVDAPTPDTASAYGEDQADGALSSAAVPRPAASALMPLR